MNKTRWKIAFICVLTLSTQMLIGCNDLGISMYQFTPTARFVQPVPVATELPYPAYADTQAFDTPVPIAQQTKTAQDATATYSSYLLGVTQTVQAISILNAQITQTAQAEATLEAYPLKVTSAVQSRNATEAAQTRALMIAEATQTVQAQRTGTAFPLTATPLAATRSALLMQEYDWEQRAFNDQVVAPLKPALAVLFFLSVSVGLVFAYRRVGTSLHYRVIGPQPGHRRPLLIDSHISRKYTIDGTISNSDAGFRRKDALKLSPASSPGGPDPVVHVEIVDAADPPVADWISEVERRLAGKGGHDF